MENMQETKLSEYELLRKALRNRGYLTIKHGSNAVDFVSDAQVLQIQLEGNDGYVAVINVRRLLSDMVLRKDFNPLGKVDKTFSANALAAVMQLSADDFEYWSYNGLIKPSVRSWMHTSPLFSWTDMFVAIVMHVLRNGGVMPIHLENLQSAIINLIEEERQLQ